MAKGPRLDYAARMTIGRSFIAWAVAGASVAVGEAQLRPEDKPPVKSAAPAREQAIKLPEWWNPADPLPAEQTNCVRCHLTAGRELTTPLRDFAGSGHDRAGLSCNDCHGGHTEDDAMAHDHDHGFIGTKLSAHIAACAECHVEEAESLRRGPHYWDFSKRVNRDYPSCIDCHGNHDVGKPPADFALANVCSDCHKDFVGTFPRESAIVAENDRLWQSLRRVQGRRHNAAGAVPAEFRDEVAALRYTTARLIHPAGRVSPQKTNVLNARVAMLRDRLESWLTSPAKPDKRDGDP
jgi:hypothetical protein